MGTSKIVSFETPNVGDNFFGVHQYCQSFITPYAFTVTAVWLKLYLTNDPVGNVDVGIYAVDGAHKPTGAALSTGAIAVSTVDDSGSAYEFTMTPYALAGGSTEYQIWWKAVDMPNSIYHYGLASNGYNDGVTFESHDSGSSWAANSDHEDCYFQVWGIARKVHIT